jgi:hypothetical protein
MNAGQPSLLGLGVPPGADPGFEGVGRLPLAHGAWVEHGTSWLSGHSILFEELRDNMDWQVHRRIYRDGRDSVGERRRFLMKPTHGKELRTFTLGWGDFIVMEGSCQRTWRHGVPKTSHAGPRMAIMFRSSTFSRR